MKIYLGTDHAGFDLKEKIKSFLSNNGYEVEDCGAFTYDQNDDYPDFILPVARKVSDDPNSMGIVFGKSGAGECMAANKVKGIRAILGFSNENVKLAREHNNANILAIGSMFISQNQTEKLVKLFLETPFSNEERHKRRIEKIRKIEDNKI